MKDRIAKAVFWIVWSRVGLHGLSFLSTLIVVRILSPADYGLMALAGVWIHILSLLVEVDLGSAIIQFPDLEDSELNACFWLTTCMTLFGCVSLIFAAPWISDWFSSPRLADILPIVALALPLAGAKVVPYSLLKKALELDKVSKTEIVASVISIPTVLSLAWAGAGVWALVIGALLPMVIQSMGSFWFVKWRPGFRVSGKRVGPMLRYSLKTTGSNVAWAVWMKAPTVILGKVSGESLLGIYSIAMEIATTLTDKISMMVQQLAFPVMAELQKDSGAMRHSMLKAIRLLAVLVFPLTIGMILLAEDFVLLVLTDKWVSVVPLLQILSVYALYQSLYFLFPIILKARYRVTFLLYFNLVFLGVMPVSFLIGAEFVGPIGVAFVWLTIYPLMGMRLVREACREVGIGWIVLWKQLSITIGSTLVMTGVVLIVQWLVPGEEVIARMLRMVVAVLLGGFSYGAVILFRGGQVSQEIREVMGWMVGLREELAMKHIIGFCKYLARGKAEKLSP